MIDPGPLVRRVLAEAGPSNGEEIEVYAAATRERRYESTSGRLENAESRNGFGVAVRVIAGGRLGFAYRSDSRPTELIAAVAEARSLARQTASDPARGLPGRREPAAALGLAPLDLDAVPRAQKLELIKRLEAATLAADSRVRTAHQAMYHETDTRVALVNSRGVDLAWTVQEFSLAVAALAEAGGDTQLGEEYRVWRGWDDLDPEAVGRAAGEKAARLLGASPIPTARRDLVLPPVLVAGILETALPAWSAEAVQRGRSFLAGREGQAVAGERVTLVDDGTLPGGIATSPADDEGIPRQRTNLVTRGRLNGFLHNHETARRAGTASTGNAHRVSIQSPPAVGPSNLLLLPGAAHQAEILARAEGGLLLAEVLGLHTLDAVTGEFSLGASGWLIEHGAPGCPVRGVTIAGSLSDLLRQVDDLGSDLTTYGRFSVPTLLVRDIMVAGALRSKAQSR
jgi:PmbA protein